jgi:hypothetical protein
VVIAGVEAKSYFVVGNGNSPVADKPIVRPVASHQESKTAPPRRQTAVEMLLTNMGILKKADHVENKQEKAKVAILKNMGILKQADHVEEKQAKHHSAVKAKVAILKNMGILKKANHVEENQAKHHSAVKAKVALPPFAGLDKKSSESGVAILGNMGILKKADHVKEKQAKAKVAILGNMGILKQADHVEEKQAKQNIAQQFYTPAVAATARHRQAKVAKDAANVHLKNKAALKKVVKAEVAGKDAAATAAQKEEKKSLDDSQNVVPEADFEESITTLSSSPDAVEEIMPPVEDKKDMKKAKQEVSLFPW